MSDERTNDRERQENEEIKVTDRRIFTPDGRLRDEYSYLEKEGAGGESPPAAVAPESPPQAPPPAEPEVTPPAAAPPAGGEGATPGAQRPPIDLPPSAEGPGAPTFYDLVAVLAEPVQVYLGDVELPGGRSGENLQMARLHIDLLEILRTKTAMSLSSQESAFLEDVLYQLRMRYVQKRG